MYVFNFSLCIMQGNDTFHPKERPVPCLSIKLPICISSINSSYYSATVVTTWDNIFANTRICYYFGTTVAFRRLSLNSGVELLHFTRCEGCGVDL